MDLNCVTKVVIRSCDIEPGILPDLATSMNSDELSLGDCEAIGIEEDGRDIGFVNLHGVGDFSVKLLEVEVNSEVEVKVACAGFLDVCVRAYVD